MIINDLRLAVDDLVETGKAVDNSGVYVEGINGAESIDGMDTVKIGEFTGIFVLDGMGRPAVSRRLYDDKINEIEEMRKTISTNVSCSRCVNQLAEEWEIINKSFVCYECALEFYNERADKNE